MKEKFLNILAGIVPAIFIVGLFIMMVGPELWMIVGGLAVVGFSAFYVNGLIEMSEKEEL